MWIKASNFNNPPEGRIISKASGIEAQQHYFLLSTAYNRGAVRLRARLKINGTTRTVFADSGEIHLNQWTHVAASFDGNTIRLFQNGAQVGLLSAPGKIDRNSSIPVWLGANPPVVKDRPFAGEIRELKIISSALTGAEIIEAGRSQ